MSWESFAMPVKWRRTFAELVTKDLVSVQPMSAPSGKVFYMDFKYNPKSRALAPFRIDINGRDIC